MGNAIPGKEILRKAWELDGTFGSDATMLCAIFCLGLGVSRVGSWIMFVLSRQFILHGN